jgi:hypothetical protein
MAGGVLNKAASHPGAVVPTVIIGTFALPVNQQAFVSEFAAEMGPGGTNGLFILQMSNDAFVGNIVEKDRIEMPSPGSFLKTYDSGLLIPTGYAMRVLFSQSVAGPVGSVISGSVERKDDSSLPGNNIIDL